VLGLPDAHALLLFCLAGLLLLIVPGPSVLYIVGRSIGQGRKAGVVSTLGIATGSLVHVTAAAVGVSAILASSAVAFSIVKYAGAAYLVFLGVRKILGHDRSVAEGAPPESLKRIYVRGVVVNVLNPKTALFFLALLPQFVDPARGLVAVQMILLGLTFSGMGVITDGSYALLASGIGDWLRRRPSFLRRQEVVTGSVFITLGVAAAATGAHHRSS
jgi:threonine/homoserine/homoserine lactone efflux protein